MKRLLPLALILLFASPAEAQVTPPWRGGTGTGTSPSYGQVLVGNGNGLYTLTATSALGISGSNLSDTDDLDEGTTNLYWTLARFAGALAGTTTDALSEGSTNQYFTNARARGAISTSATGLSYSSATGVLSLAAGYVIPLTASTTDWQTAFSWGNHASQGYLTDYTVTEGDVTAHEAALSITESQISDLDHYTDADIAGSETAFTGWDKNASDDYASGDFDTDLATKDTGDLAEGSNLYYTLARWAAALAGTTTDALSEGSTNRYYTDTRVNTLLNASSTLSLPLCDSGEIAKWNGSRWACAEDNAADGAFATSSADYWESQQTARTADDLSDNDTGDLSEGSNLYYTPARVNDLINASTTIARTPDLHSAVTLAGSLDYLTLSGQQLTRNAVDLTTDVSGVLPDANVADNITASSYLLLTGGSLSGNLSISGNATTTGTTWLGRLMSPRVNDTIYIDGTTYAKTSVGIQAALDACATLTECSTVRVPAGEYTLSGQSFTFDKDGMKLLGAGASTTILGVDASFSNGNGGMIIDHTDEGRQNIEISGFTFDASGQTDVGFIRFGQSHHINIHHNVFTNASTPDGIWGINVGKSGVTNDPADNSYSIKVHDNYFIDNDFGTFEGIIAIQVAHSKFNDNYFERNDSQNAYILLCYAYCVDTEFAGNHFKDDIGNSIGVQESDRISVHHNTVEHSGNHHAITLFNVIDSDVSHNLLFASSTVSTNNTGLRVIDDTDGPDSNPLRNATSTNIRFTENEVTGFNYGFYMGLGGTGFELGQQYIFVENNLFDEIQTFPVYAGDSTDAEDIDYFFVRGNKILDWEGTNTGAIQLRGPTANPEKFANIFIEDNYIKPSNGGASSGGIRLIGVTAERISGNYLVGTGQSFNDISFANNGTANIIEGNTHEATDLWVGKSTTGTELFKFSNTGILTFASTAYIGSKLGVGKAPTSQLHVYQDSTDVGSGTGVLIEQDGTGDAGLNFLLTGAQRYMIGIDNSDSDTFKIASSLDLGTDTLLAIDSSGTVSIADLANCDTIDTDADGTLSCGTDDGGGGGGSTLHVDAGAYVYPHQGNYHSAPHYVATSTTATSTFAGAIQMTADGVANYGGNNPGEGFFSVTMGESRGSAFNFQASSTAQAGDGELFRFEQLNPAHANELIKIENDSTQGGSEEIMIISPVPDIGMCDNTDSANDCVELEVENHGSFLINSRNTGDTAFERNVIIAAARLGGMVGFGTGFDTPFLDSKMTIVGHTSFAEHDYLDINATSTSAGGDIFTIAADGQVGIGDSTPDTALQVNGTTTTTNLTVSGAVSLLGEYFTNFTTYVRSLFSAGTGLTYSAGQFAINQAANLTWTGNQNFGGAAFLEIPNGTGPTANDPGEIAHDTSDNQLILDDFVVAKRENRIWGVTFASTSQAFISGSTFGVPPEIDGYTVTSIFCKVDGGTSKVIAIEDASGNSSEDITCTTDVTSDDGSITNATVTAEEEMYIDFGATSGAVDTVSISVFGTWTRE